VKVAAEGPEFPELIHHVHTDVGDGAVRSDDHFLALFSVVVARISIASSPALA
jgi:hypothetical protein